MQMLEPLMFGFLPINVQKSTNLKFIIILADFVAAVLMILFGKWADVYLRLFFYSLR